MNIRVLLPIVLLSGVAVGIISTIMFINSKREESDSGLITNPANTNPTEYIIPTASYSPIPPIKPTVPFITPTLTPASPTPNANEQISSVIKNFETAIINRQVSELLSMFTAPSLPSEIDSYNSMMGLDATGPRLFNTAGSNFRINTWEIINIDYGNSADFEIRVIVDEQRKGWSPAVGEYGELVESRMIIELARINGELKITNYYYYWGDAGGGSAKYRGLGF